jgi:hypothetical protein
VRDWCVIRRYTYPLRQRRKLFDLKRKAAAMDSGENQTIDERVLTDAELLEVGGGSAIRAIKG